MTKSELIIFVESKYQVKVLKIKKNKELLKDDAVISHNESIKIQLTSFKNQLRVFADKMSVCLSGNQNKVGKLRKVVEVLIKDVI